MDISFNKFCFDTHTAEHSLHLVSLSFSLSVFSSQENLTHLKGMILNSVPRIYVKVILFAASLRGGVLQLYEVTGLYNVTLKLFFYFWVASLSYWGLESVSLFSGVVTLQPADPQQAFSWI